MKIEKEPVWVLTKEKGYSEFGWLTLIMRESYTSEKITIKANKANWDLLEVVSRAMGFYGWSRSEMVIEKTKLFRCRKCRKSSKEEKCNYCNIQCDPISYSNGVYILEPISMLMAHREQILKDSHTLKVIEIIQLAKEHATLMDKMIPKTDNIATK